MTLFQTLLEHPGKYQRGRAQHSGYGGSLRLTVDSISMGQYSFRLDQYLPCALRSSWIH